MNDDDLGMTFLTIPQFFQLGKKCSMCQEKAKWLDKFDESRPAYCDKHFPGRIYEYEIHKETKCD